MNILRLKIGTNLVSVIKEQKYYFESERILLYNVQVISLLVHFQMNIKMIFLYFIHKIFRSEMITRNL